MESIIVVKLRIVFVLLAFPCFNTFYAAMSSPSIRCISVSANGDVTINWVIPTGSSAEFLSYRVFKSTDNGLTFILVNTISNYLTTNYTDVGAGANMASVSYYVKTEFNDGTGIQSSPSSDTLHSILLSLSSPSRGIASLNWNTIHAPKLASHDDYKIFKRVPAGSWVFIGITTYGTESFETRIKACSDLLEFKIEVTDASGCTSVSNIANKLFQDNTPPDVPIIDSVSVDASTGAIIVGWKKGLASDIAGYVTAYLYNGNTFLDTVKGANTTFFLDNSANGNLQAERYGVFSYDSCNIASPTGIIHKTVYLTKSQALCDKDVTLNWTQYEGWSAGVGAYMVLVSENNGPFQTVYTGSSSNFSFSHGGLTPGSTYDYIIRAVKSNGTATSSSNKVSTLIATSKLPLHNYISTVSVESDSKVKIESYIDPATTASSYRLKKSINNSTDFKTIQEIPIATIPEITFYDSDVKPSEEIYFYQVVVVDQCGNEVMTSNTSKTIFLTGYAHPDDLINELTWTPYADWTTHGNGVEEYNLYFGQDETSIVTFSASVLSDKQKYFDPIIGEPPPSGKYCYYVEAVEANGNVYGLKQTSKSNIRCLNQNPIIFTPTAFTPNDDGVNDIFKPEISHINVDDYSFSIYNRWGKRVFETKDIFTGWSGSEGNFKEPQGIYMYVLNVSDSEEHKIRKQGQVMLLR